MGTQYKPNIVSSPKETIKEMLSERNLTQYDFLIQDEIDLQLASSLETVLGVSYLFWLTRSYKFLKQ